MSGAFDNDVPEGVSTFLEKRPPAFPGARFLRHARLSPVGSMRPSRAP